MATTTESPFTYPLQPYFKDVESHIKHIKEHREFYGKILGKDYDLLTIVSNKRQKSGKKLIKEI